MTFAIQLARFIKTRSQQRKLPAQNKGGGGQKPAPLTNRSERAKRFLTDV